MSGHVRSHRHSLTQHKPDPPVRPWFFQDAAVMRDSAKVAYDDRDYPETLPIPRSDFGLVLLRVEESVHYSLRDDAKSEAEWETLFPANKGFIKLGPQGHEFTISMFHQLHCLKMIRDAMIPRSYHVPRYHLDHCMNQLRQVSAHTR